MSCILEKDPFTELTLVHEILNDDDDIQEIVYIPFTVVMYKEEPLVFS